MKNVQFLLDPPLTSDGPQAPSRTNNASYTILIVYTVTKSLYIRVRLTRQCVYMHCSVVPAFTKGNMCTGDSILQWIRSMLINTACLSRSTVEQIRGTFLCSTCTEAVFCKHFDPRIFFTYSMNMKNIFWTSIEHCVIGKDFSSLYPND